MINSVSDTSIIFCMFAGYGVSGGESWLGFQGFMYEGSIPANLLCYAQLLKFPTECQEERKDSGLFLEVLVRIHAMIPADNRTLHDPKYPEPWELWYCSTLHKVMQEFYL